MVKEIKDYNIIKNTCVILTYGQRQYISLWDFDNRNDFRFNSPYIELERLDKNTAGSFRLDDKCEFVRYATQDEILELQKYLDSKGMNVKINFSNIYEVW